MKEVNDFIFVHRGIHDNKKVFENTLEAFLLAKKKGMNIELDIHLLKDNKVVVYHDDNLKRLTGIDKDIKDLTYEELKKIKIRNQFMIPLLTDVLTLIDGKVVLNIEIKDDKRMIDTCKALVKILDEYTGTFLIQSFHIKYIRWFKKSRKKYISGYLLNPFKIYSKFYKCDFFVCEKLFIKKKRIQKLRKKVPLFVWTIKSKEELKYYRQYADSFIVSIRH